MADLHFFDSALRILFYYSLTDEPFRVWFFRAFSSFHITGRCSAIRKMFYTTRAKQEISTFALSET